MYSIHLIIDSKAALAYYIRSVCLLQILLIYLIVFWPLSLTFINNYLTTLNYNDLYVYIIYVTNCTVKVSTASLLNKCLIQVRILDHTFAEKKTVKWM